MGEQGKWDIRLIRSKRKSIGIQINEDLSITVRAPLGVSITQVRCFVEKQTPWIEKHLEILEKRKEQQEAHPIEKLSDTQLRQLANKAKKVIPDKVSFYAHRIGVTYERITIRNQRSRWGSCSSKANLNFNCLLMLMPEEILDYVVVHELCHRIEMNHSKRFWTIVEQILPDYKERKKWLKDHGEEYMRRML